jgi:uncharacterized membrane protein YkgB
MTAPETPQEFPQEPPQQQWQQVPQQPYQQYPPQESPAQQQAYQQYQQLQPYPQTPGNGVGVTGFVTGLLGLIFFWVPFIGIILGILGVVFGGVGFQQFRKRGQTNGLAIAGLVLGIITVAIYIIFWIAVASSVHTYTY